MRALMTREAYDQFVELRAALPARGVSNLAQVFVPVGPIIDSGEAKRLRLFFVGRATRAYAEDEVSTYEGALARDAKIVACYKSPFWAFIRRIASETHEHLGVEPIDDFRTVCGWTNLAKIGDTKGNATPLSVSIQASLCHAAMRAEIALMKPHAVVIMTGNYGIPELFEPMFGSDDWTPSDQPPTRFKRHAEVGALLVHTYHPQCKKGSREMAAMISRLIAASL